MFRKSVMSAAALGALMLAGGGAAAATQLASTTTVAVPAGTVQGCVSGAGRTMTNVHTASATKITCPSGSFWAAWNQAGPRGAAGATGPAGATGATGATGPAGPAGANGSNGASAVTTIQAATAVTNWPEGSGWGTDNFGRTLNVTVEDQVNSSHCNGAPVCYAVFGTLTDTGTTTPVNGHAGPNGSSSAPIVAANFSGPVTMKGTATFQFYATSNKISASNVPAKQNGKGTTSTTAWGELAFPAGTAFYSVGLTAYDWTYTAPVAYTVSGTEVSCTQVWNDQVNPGTDGQGAADGNITGTCAS